MLIPIFPQLLRQPDLTLALALCEVCTVGDYDHLTEVLMKVFHTPQSMGRFLKAIIELEVSVAGQYRPSSSRCVADVDDVDQEGTLFRGNSFATRILTVYARARGYHCKSPPLQRRLLLIYAFQTSVTPSTTSSSTSATSPSTSPSISTLIDPATSQPRPTTSSK